MADLVTVTISTSGTWRVPGHVPGTLKMIAVGGGGGDYDPNNSNITNRGGIGGWIRGTIDLARGTVLTIGIGGRGDDAEINYVDLPLGGGGPRPGGDGGLYGSHSSGDIQRAGAGGGGGTEVKIGATVVAVAGGGGGGGTKSSLNSGNRAGDGAQQTGSGDNGTPNAATASLGQGGRGATTSAAGAGGDSNTTKYPTYVEAGHPGSGGDGGDGASVIIVPGSPLASSNTGGGGGGGGGYYGAGGGGGSWLSVDAGRGGGGSSWSNATYVTEGVVSSLAVPVDNVPGYVIFEYEPSGGIFVDGAVH